MGNYLNLLGYTRSQLPHAGCLAVYVGFSSLGRDWTWAICTGSGDLATEPPGQSLKILTFKSAFESKEDWRDSSYS